MALHTRKHKQHYLIIAPHNLLDSRGINECVYVCVCHAYVFSCHLCRRKLIISKNLNPALSSDC